MYQDIPLFKMNSNYNWDWHSKLRLKEKYGQLTLADLKFEAGQENELIRRIASRLKKTYWEVNDILKNLYMI